MYDNKKKINIAFKYITMLGSLYTQRIYIIDANSTWNTAHATTTTIKTPFAHMTVVLYSFYKVTFTQYSTCMSYRNTAVLTKEAKEETAGTRTAWDLAHPAASAAATTCLCACELLPKFSHTAAAVRLPTAWPHGLKPPTPLPAVSAPTPLSVFCLILIITRHLAVRCKVPTPASASGAIQSAGPGRICTAT